MLFNSAAYIFLFLPCVIAGYFLLNRARFVTAATAWLVLSSLFFYGCWKPGYLLLLTVSIMVNFALGTMLHQSGRKLRSPRRQELGRRSILVVGILFNLGLLGYYKYADFFLSNVNRLFNSSLPLPNLLLPLAISFFTFQQIAYLFDCSRDNAKEYDFLSYCLFVAFFPQLIAGPIVHHQEMMPQFVRLRNRLFSFPNAALGIFFFSLGLFKKVWIADQFSVWASLGFSAKNALTFFDAWGTALSYTFQLYFDFSGYTDMAIGSALLFNIVLPINFNSPYQSVNIQDFWQRWHVTLSRWLREYLYIPLGGNRKGPLRTYLNLFITFVLAGLWHGAGWTFVIWGALHGAALVLHRLWKNVGLRMPALMGWLLTFLFVSASWVIFRAVNTLEGLYILQSMAGLNGFAVSPSIAKLLAGLHEPLAGLSSKTLLLPAETGWHLLFFSFVLFLIPNSCRIGGLIAEKKENEQPASRMKNLPRQAARFFLRFQPNCYWALISGILFAMALYRLLRVAPTEFLYFNF
jgi:D-alanyl-lipoteichoic acid acyltransferase DltB (MBOAT superfamily)